MISLGLNAILYIVHGRFISIQIHTRHCQFRISGQLLLKLNLGKVLHSILVYFTKKKYLNHFEAKLNISLAYKYSIDLTKIEVFKGCNYDTNIIREQSVFGL